MGENVVVKFVLDRELGVVGGVGTRHDDHVLACGAKNVNVAPSIGASCSLLVVYRRRERCMIAREGLRDTLRRGRHHTT
jgi:hypothetical protein